MTIAPPSHDRCGRTAWGIACFFLLLPPVMLAPIWRLWGLSALEDGLLYYFPQRAWFGASLASGDWPLWHGLIYGGFPAFADPQIAMWYPATWLFAVLRPELAYPLSISLHHSLAGWLMYRLCRGLGRSRWAAVLAGVTFMFCGFMLSHREHLTMHHAAAWVPGVLWAWHRWSQTLRVKHWVVGVLMIALQLLAGHVQVSLMTAPVVVAWVIWSSPRRYWLWLGCIAGFVAAGLVCAVQILPAMQLMRLSAGRAEAYFVLYNSMLWKSLTLLIFPMLLGQRIPNFYPAKWYVHSHQCEQTAYVTLIVLALAVGAVILLWRRDRQVRFWTGTLVVSLLLALGKNAGVYVLLMAVPVFNVLHTPARWLLMVHVALILLGAAGADAILHPSQESSRNERLWRRTVPIILCCAALTILSWFAFSTSAQLGRAVGLANPAIWMPLLLLATTLAGLLRVADGGTRGRAWILLVLLLVDLASIAPFLDVSPKAREAITHSPAAEVLRRSGFDPRSDRVWVIPGDAYLSPRQCMMPDTNLLDGMGTLNGYGPMLPKEHKELFALRPFGVTEEAAEWLMRPRRLARMGVSHVVVRDREVPATFELAPGWILLDTVDGNVRVCRNRDPAGLSYVSGSYHWYSREQEVINTLRRTGDDADGDQAVLLTGQPRPNLSVGPGRIISSEVSTNSARFEIDSQAGTLLVWLNRSCPGWRARLGDREIPIYRANALGQAVFLPPGRQLVIFDFAPRLFRWSAGLSIVSLGGLLVVLIFSLRKGPISRAGASNA
ncbi:MAG: hypothetical protein JXQ73_28515 [Phycisphaerae bacterium]|nr:hypothetical protein [Phycisphaerae bacterium]